MDQFKKHEIKKKIKEKKVWFIGTGIFLLCGIIAWIIGSYLSGADPIQWLTNPFACTIYILIGLAIVIFGIFIFAILMKKEGDK